MATSKRGSQWLVATIFGLVSLLSLSLRARAIRDNSPTFDEPFHLFHGVFFEQKNRWDEIDLNPPLFHWMIGKASPLLGNFRDAEAFMEDRATFTSPFQYRLDLFSGLPEDQALQRARTLFSGFWVLGTLAFVWLARRFGANRWGVLTVYGFLALEPSLLAHSAVLKNDYPALALLVLGTALSLASSEWIWVLAWVAFAGAWSMKWAVGLWALPLAAGFWARKIPARTLVLWVSSLVGALMVSKLLHYPVFGSAPATGPNFRLSYLDGILYARTPLTYFLQAFLCKASLATLAVWIWAAWSARNEGKARWFGVGSLLLVLTLVISSLLLPGLGIRLVLPLLAAALFAAALHVRTVGVMLVLLSLLAIETTWNGNRLLAYQSPLAGAEPRLLDSNRDWGQGLKALVEWRRHHDDAPLALALFGGTPPETYGLTNYRALPSAPELTSSARLESGDFKGYVAVSENFLHGYFVNDPNLRALSAYEPLTCFGGGLCLYDVRRPPHERP